MLSTILILCAVGAPLQGAPLAAKSVTTVEAVSPDSALISAPVLGPLKPYTTSADTRSVFKLNKLKKFSPAADRQLVTAVAPVRKVALVKPIVVKVVTSVAPLVVTDETIAPAAPSILTTVVATAAPPALTTTVTEVSEVTTAETVAPPTEPIGEPAATSMETTAPTTAPSTEPIAETTAPPTQTPVPTTEPPTTEAEPSAVQGWPLERLKARIEQPFVKSVFEDHKARGFDHSALHGYTYFFSFP